MAGQRPLNFGSKKNMARRYRLNGTTLFLKEVLNKPRQIGAIVPSSRNLARAMARWLPPRFEACALELGPGTGAVTQALLDKGLAPERLLAIEKSPQLAEHLRQRFPQVRVIVGDALELDQLLAADLSQGALFPVVFSSLPLCNFPSQDASQLAQKILAVLAPHGKFVQYSYHLSAKKAKLLPHLRYVTSDVVWFNIPPARVSVYQR
jgi:phospholipid N-methyltransferase